MENSADQNKESWLDKNKNNQGDYATFSHYSTTITGCATLPLSEFRRI